MPIMKNHILAIAIAAATAAAGCVGFEHSRSTSGASTTAPTGPSGTTMNALMGTWASASAAFPTPSSCTNFKWSVTEQTATSAKGSFSATCPGSLNVTGTAQGTLSGTTITWSAVGNATGPGLSACAITLNGTAELGVDSIRVPYAGDTCLGKVSGVEILTRH
jgi:hypothetical protein